MIHFTPNVRFSLAQAMAWMLDVAGEVYQRNGYELWVTSAMDGVHTATSVHGKGRAMDFRTHHVDKQLLKMQILDQLQTLLSPTFFVQIEDTGGPNEHIHVEYKG